MKLSLRQGNNILGAIGVLLGTVIVVLGYVQKLPFVKNGMPGPGFFPIICGIGIAIFSALLIVENKSKAKKALENQEKDNDLEENILDKAELKNFVYSIGSGNLVIILAPLIGMITSIGIAVAIMIKVLGEDSLVKAIIIGAGTSLVLFLIFKVFLGVPLPNSYIGL